jgi:hypothetical protein
MEAAAKAAPWGKKIQAATEDFRFVRPALNAGAGDEI